MAVYSVFKELHLDVTAHPIFDLQSNYLFEDFDPDHPERDRWDNKKYREEHGDSEDDAEKSFAGNSFGRIIVTELGYDVSREEILAEADGHWLRVKWLNKPSWRHLSFLHVTVSMHSFLNINLVTDNRFSMETNLALTRCIAVLLWSLPFLKLLRARILACWKLLGELFGAVSV